jgi:hypothetical protein
MKWIVCLLMIAVAISGCTTKAKSKAQARRAYIAGHQRALAEAQEESQGPVVVITGNVAYHTIPWTEDLTLAQALIAAEYKGAGDPGGITVVRNGERINVDVNRLLHGEDMPLAASDRIEIRP